MSPTNDEKQTGMPRRFGIGSILVITLAFSLLFAMLRALGAPGPLYGFFTVFLVVVAIAQMVLFGGSDPRKASIVTGLFLLPICVVPMLFLSADASGHSPPTEAFLCFFIVALPMGALSGYCAGGLVGGVFLLMNMADDFIHRNRVIVAELVDDDDRLE